MSNNFKHRVGLQSKLKAMENYVSKGYYVFECTDIKIYINTTKRLFKSSGYLSLVTFNQDILTDEGLCKAQIVGWHRFDDSIRLRILPVIINKGDAFSASAYFFAILN